MVFTAARYTLPVITAREHRLPVFATRVHGWSKHTLYAPVNTARIHRPYSRVLGTLPYSQPLNTARVHGCLKDAVTSVFMARVLRPRSRVCTETNTATFSVSQLAKGEARNCGRK